MSDKMPVTQKIYIFFCAVWRTTTCIIFKTFEIIAEEEELNEIGDGVKMCAKTCVEVLKLRSLMKYMIQITLIRK